MIIEGRKRGKAEVNIVPMVDVLTVIIFFFLLTMQFKSNYAVDITPPKMDSASPSSTARIPTVSVTKDGKFFYDGELLDFDILKSKISDIGKTENPAMALLADKDAPFKHITAVIDVAKLSGVKKLSIQTATE